MVTWKHLAALRCHSDAGSEFTSIRYGEYLAEIGVTPSIGTVGDGSDNALAETVNGYYKAELVRGSAKSCPWKTIDELELATLGWVHWHIRASSKPRALQTVLVANVVAGARHAGASCSKMCSNGRMLAHR